MLNTLRAWLYGQRERALYLQRALTQIPALGPENGGQGELAKAELVADVLKEAHIDFKRYDSPDVRVESGIRPNLVAIRKGENPQKLWLFGHLDVVPPGDIAAWQSDPYTLRCDGDMVYGRGVEDNQQAIVSMLLLGEALNELRLKTRLGLGLVFMADEECGSRHGLDWLLNNHGEIFGKDDLYIVPDGGSQDASLVEIAEKAQLWLKFTVLGRQCHASTPDEGINALVAASSLILELSGLKKYFPEINPLFTPQNSTFVPTLHEKNVPAVNILSGKDVFFMDCRLLPELPPALVMEKVKQLTHAVEEKFAVKINVETVQEQKASSVSPDCPVVVSLRKAVKDVYGVDLRPTGIGGATVAAFLRQKGFNAVVWSCIIGTCHQPNERSSLMAACRDAAVFGSILEQD